MFLDTANIEEIRKAMRTGVFKGVTTNPTILLNERTPRAEKVREILEEGVLLSTCRPSAKQ